MNEMPKEIWVSFATGGGVQGQWLRRWDKQEFEHGQRYLREDVASTQNKEALKEAWDALCFAEIDLKQFYGDDCYERSTLGYIRKALRTIEILTKGE
jgi:hypothetical protein